MACFHPLEAIRKGLTVSILGPASKDRLQYLEGREVFLLPCGRCIGCRSVRARAYAIRCMHEASLYDRNCFVTLTYRDGDCPLSLNYHDFQLFMRYLRRDFRDVRFFMCGEYGELWRRPHFHALLFGVYFDDGVVCGKNDLKSSATLSKYWRHGFASYGSVTRESAGYVSRYCVKKITGEISDVFYTRLDPVSGELVSVVPEFGRMSLGGRTGSRGIGYRWFCKYWKEVYKGRDGVVMPGGRVVPPPRYYDRLLLDVAEADSDGVSFDRYVRSERFVEDCTPARLLVREQCAKARESFRRRSL